MKHRGPVLLKVILLLKREKEKVTTEMVWGTEVKWQVLSTCLEPYISSHGCPDGPVVLPLLLVSTREPKRKEHFAGKFPINT